MSGGECQIPMPEFDQEDEYKLWKPLGENAQQEEKTSSNGQGQGSKPKIQRVPEVMNAEIKECRAKYFTPKAIAIGPIHAHSEDLFVGEALKLTWAAKYLDGLDGKKILQKIRDEIESLKKEFDKKCFDRDAIWNSGEDKYVYGTLARMLFVDGCAMLQFIYSLVWGDDFVKHLKINAAQATLVQQDLFLLENQIPFRVLEIIMARGKNKQQEQKKEYFGKRNMKNPVEWFKSDGQEAEDSEKLTKMETAVQVFIHQSKMSTASRPDFSLNFDGGAHLLDLLRRSILDDSAQPDVFSKNSFNVFSKNTFNCLLVKFPVFIIFKLPLYVLYFLACLTAIIVVTFFYIIYRFMYCGFFAKSPVPYWRIAGFCMLICLGIGLGSHKSPITRRTFRNVQELKAAGIKLKPNKSKHLNEVSFSPGWFSGCLRLCPIMVDKWTEGKLLNLIAYEMCPDYHWKIKKDSKSYDYRISSYLSLLDSLIDNEQDVKDLRAASILRHRLSSDEEVAKLFNTIIIPNSMVDDEYGNVNSQIQEYYERNIPIWIAEFCQEHLSSPWTFLALIAAVLVLGLTATQTYFTINPR